VRELLDRSIESKGVVDIFAAAGIDKADTSILDEAFLEEFKSHEQENLRVRLLAKILADEIQVREKMNLTKYRSFREMLEQTLQKYHNRAIQAADVVRVMLEIRKDIESEAERSKMLNLTPEEIAFYDAVAANILSLFDQKTLCELIRDVVQSVKKNLKVDWTKPHREDVKAGVRAAVKAALRKRGVKKELLDALTDKVIVQAEAMFKDWPLAA
jgi:type I restriction enzyme R subunit